MAVNTASLKAFTSALGRHLLEAVDRKLDLLLHRQTADSMASDAPRMSICAIKKPQAGPNCWKGWPKPVG